MDIGKVPVFITMVMVSAISCNIGMHLGQKTSLVVSGTDADLFAAIAHVESKGDTQEINEEEQAFGIVQIREIFVDDVNRILRDVYRRPERFTHEDALDFDKARLMWNIYHHHYRLATLDFSYQGTARRHVGGPDGHTQDETLPYLDLVQQAM